MKVRSKSLSAGNILGEATIGDSVKQALVKDVFDSFEETERNLLERALLLAESVQQGSAKCSDLAIYNKLAIEVFNAEVALWQDLVKSTGNKNLEFPYTPPLFGKKRLLDPTACRQSGFCYLNIVEACTGNKINMDEMCIWVHESKHWDMFQKYQPGHCLRQAQAVSSSPGLAGLGALPFLVVGALWILGFTAAFSAIALVLYDQIGPGSLNRHKRNIEELNVKIRIKAARYVSECRKDLIVSGVDPIEAGERCMKEADKLHPPAKVQGDSIFDGFAGGILKLGLIIGGGLYVINRFTEGGVQRAAKRRLR